MGLREHNSVVLLLALESKACGQWESCMGFRELSSVALLLVQGEPSLLACTFCYLWSGRSHGSCLHRDASFPVMSV
jgi:hypothetical protein